MSEQWTKTFSQTGDFLAFNLAVAELERAGFSVGSMQRDDPIGVMFGNYDISKWRNLNAREVNALHGRITGSKRSGPVTITLDNAPREAIAAMGSQP